MKPRRPIKPKPWLVDATPNGGKRRTFHTHGEAAQYATDWSTLTTLLRVEANRITPQRGTSKHQPSEDELSERAFREGVKRRDGYRCVARRPEICTGQPDHAHHLKRRSQGGRNEIDNGVTVVCFDCHDWIHRNPAAARSLGLLKHRTDD